MAKARATLQAKGSARARLGSFTGGWEIEHRYGVETLEEAFFAATGRTFEDEWDQEEEEVNV